MFNTFLNKNLIYKQGITPEAVEQIEQLHELMDDVVEHPEKYENPVALIEKLEYKMQELWKFKQDRNFHTHWLRIKGCTCPKMDNRERVGTGLYAINGNCPWHGLE